MTTHHHPHTRNSDTPHLTDGELETTPVFHDGMELTIGSVLSFHLISVHFIVAA